MAKQSKKLTRRQKEILSRKGLDATQYRLVSQDNNTFTVIHIKRNETKTFMI